MIPRMVIGAALANGYWSMERSALSSMLTALAAASLRVSPAERAAAGTTTTPGRLFERMGDTAIIPVRGVMMPETPWWAEWLGLEVCDTYHVQAEVAAAAADDGIAAIVLDVSSPGGAITGVAELADLVHAARAEKPVYALVDELCASAAYEVASQANVITANPTAQIGSIGVYWVHEDTRRMHETAGVTVDVFTSGPLKGAGVEGTSLTPTQRADAQAKVDGLCRLFAETVARGRGKPSATVEEWATGAVHLAGKAMELGLIDCVENPREALAAIYFGGR